MSQSEKTVISEPYQLYSQEESIKILIQSVKANLDCKNQRKQFNLCRSNILGKYIEPQFCQDKAIDLINCQQQSKTINKEECQQKFQAVYECGMKYEKNFSLFGNSSCVHLMDDFLKCQD